MNIPPRKSRQDMKSLAGSLGMRSQANSPHFIYLKLARLEIERERRVKDLGVANATVLRSTTRLREIEEEMLMLALKGAVSGDVPAGVKSAPPPRPARTPTDAGSGAGRIFRF